MFCKAKPHFLVHIYFIPLDCLVSFACFLSVISFGSFCFSPMCLSPLVSFVIWLQGDKFRTLSLLFFFVSNLSSLKWLSTFQTMCILLRTSLSFESNAIKFYQNF